MALAVHWGTFQLAFETIDGPLNLLRDLERRQGLPPGRFVATEAGRPFMVPAPEFPGAGRGPAPRSGRLDPGLRRATRAQSWAGASNRSAFGRIR
jgi:hypothetical protein